MTMDSGAFRVEVERRDGVVVVSPFGEIDMATAHQVAQALRPGAATVETLVLDLRGVSFLDTSGLRVVVDARERADQDGFDLVLVRGNRQIQRIIEIAGLAGALRFVDDPAAA